MSDRSSRSETAISHPPFDLVVDAPPVDIAPGIRGVRLALPFALDHVNLWLLRDGDGWTVIDAGLDDQRSRTRWQALLAEDLDGRPIHRVVATHFHPDHMGLANWLCEATGAELWTSRTEWLQGRWLAQDTSDTFVEAGRRFDHLAGLEPAVVEARATRGNAYRTRVSPPPASHRRLRHGDRLTIDGIDWQVLIGRGHAPEMISLFAAELNVLIAADQILPKISPVIGVWPAEPEADPLAEFLDSLTQYLDLPETCLVLPSHGRPFHGLHTRIDQLTTHHDERLAHTLDACTTPATVADIMPQLFDRPLDAHQLQFALGETLAHLNHLRNQAQLTRNLDPAGRHRYQRSP